MKRIMLDIEGLGLVPGSVVLSVGIVEFNETEIVQGYYANFNVQDQLDAGLVIEADTMDWWTTQGGFNAVDQFSIAGDMRQDYGWRGSHEDTATKYFEPLLRGQRMHAWTEFVCRGADEVWCLGASYDFAMLNVLWKKLGIKRGAWFFRKERCLRGRVPHEIRDTIVNEHKHNALADALAQAKGLLAWEHATNTVDNLPSTTRFIMANEKGNVEFHEMTYDP